MTKDELNKIPRWSITGHLPQLKPGAKVCYGASILWDEHRGEKAAGIALFLSMLVNECQVQPFILANDTGNRFAIRVGQGDLSEGAAILAMQGVGQAWVTDQTPVFAAYGIKETAKMRPGLHEKVFGRWEDYRNSKDPLEHAEFERTRDAYTLLAAIDPDQKLKLRQTAKGFMKRAVRRMKEERAAARPPGSNQPLVTRNEIVTGIRLCEEFLIEENTVFTMVGRRFDALVYTGPLLKCQEEPARGKFNIPADLPVNRLPESVRMTMADGESAADALRKAMLGFDRLQWIHIRRNKGYSPFADVEGLKKIRSSITARHWNKDAEFDTPTTLAEIRRAKPATDNIEAFENILNPEQPVRTDKAKRTPILSRQP